MELYRLTDDEATRIERRESEDGTALSEYLARNRGARVGETDVLFVRRTDDGEGRTTVLGLDGTGGGVVVAATPDVGGRDDLARGLESLARIDDAGHEALSAAFRAEAGEEADLRRAHAAFFGLDDPLPAAAFGHESRLVVLASAFEESVPTVADFLRARGVDVVPVEYAVYGDGDGLRLLSTRSLRAPLGDDGASTAPHGTTAPPGTERPDDAAEAADAPATGSAAAGAADGREDDGGREREGGGDDADAAPAAPEDASEGADARTDAGAGSDGVGTPRFPALVRTVRERVVSDAGGVLGSPVAEDVVRELDDRATSVDLVSTRRRHPDAVGYTFAYDAPGDGRGTLRVRVGLSLGGDAQATRIVGDRSGWLAEYDDVDLSRERFSVVDEWRVEVPDLRARDGEAVVDALAEAGVLEEVVESYVRLVERWHRVLASEYDPDREE
jgi:hypothetical protein